MNRKRISLILVLVLLLTGCGRYTPGIESTSGPGRMVRRIEVAIHPEDPEYARTYVTQENMNALLSILRPMVTAEEPPEEPNVNDGQNLYTATVTFANGQQSVYYLLGRTYLRMGDEDWCVVDASLANKFIQFILEHPSDDSVPVETTAPTETTN
jgi:hypothetical protein